MYKYVPNSYTNIQKKKILYTERAMSPISNTYDQQLVSSVERNLKENIKAFNPSEYDTNQKFIESQV